MVSIIWLYNLFNWGARWEDEIAKLKKSMEDLTASYVKKVDELTKAKETELQKV